jgi:hypothetical protein
MRVMLEANRSLYYHAAQLVDIKEQLEWKIEQFKEQGQSTTDLSARLKKLVRVANLLTPLAKYYCTEGANKITYDAIQIHGGTGYMKEFAVERLARDARITNIYEGTSQLQIVAASGGVVTDVLADWFHEKMNKEYRGSLNTLAGYMRETRELFQDCMQFVAEKRDEQYQNVASKDLVELYSYPLIGFLLLDEAEVEPRKVFIANRYIQNAYASARKNADSIKSGLYADVLHADKILV